MTPEDFRTWQSRLGLSNAAAASALGKTRRTIDRYRAGERPIPPSVEKLIWLLAEKGLWK